MARRGRPRRESFDSHLGDYLDKEMESVVGRIMGTSSIRRDAAESMQREASAKRTIWASRIRMLRKTDWARKIDSHEKLSDDHLLKRFFYDSELSTEDRCRIARIMGLQQKTSDALSKTAWREEQSGKLDEDGEQLLRARARVEQECRALSKRSVTPFVPTGDDLARFRALKPNDPATWPTLLELKMATAMSEKTLRKFIGGFPPELVKSEIVRGNLRRLGKGGALLNRYGPRVVLAVVEEFLKRLPNYPIEQAERNLLRKIAMTIKRALTFKLSRWCSST